MAFLRVLSELSDNLPCFCSRMRNSSNKKLFSATFLDAPVRMNSGYSSRSVSKQEGSRPTIGVPFSAYGASLSTFQAEFSLAWPSMPLEIIGRPQHFLLTNRTRYPDFSKKRVAAIATLGVLKLLKVS